MTYARQNVYQAKIVGRYDNLAGCISSTFIYDIRCLFDDDGTDFRNDPQNLYFIWP